MSIKVGIADDHLLVTNGLKSMLATSPDLTPVFTAHNGDELLNYLQDVQPDVLMLDIQMPGKTGIDLCKIVKEKYPSICVIALTNLEETHYVKQMIRNGASGYLLKNTDTETLLRAIGTVCQQKQFLDPQIEKRMLEEMLSGKKQASQQVALTKRELEILGLVAQELTNQQIADKLFISLRTVETHRLNLTQKLDVKNTAGLIKEAYNRGLIS